MDEKNLGYVLLSAGVLIMVASVLFLIFVVLGAIQPIGLFNIPAPTIDLAALMPQVPGLPAPKGAEMQIIPTDAFNKMINIGITFLLLGFIMSFGAKIADLGVKLLRPIKIEAKTT